MAMQFCMVPLKPWLKEAVRCVGWPLVRREPGRVDGAHAENAVERFLDIAGIEQVGPGDVLRGITGIAVSL